MMVTKTYQPAPSTTVVDGGDPAGPPVAASAAVATPSTGQSPPTATPLHRSCPRVSWDVPALVTLLV